MVSLDRRDLAKYPFLKEAQAIISAQTESLTTYLESIKGRLAIREALDTIGTALRFNPKQVHETLPDIPSDSTAIEILISSYPVSRILVSCLGDRALIDRLCRYQAWKVYWYLQEENQDKREFIARALGLSGTINTIPVIQYVEIAARIHEDRWRLVNRVVNQGQVRIEPDEMDEIIRERLRVVMAQHLPLKTPATVCAQLKPALDQIETMYQKLMLEEFGKVEESAFPPCIQAIINALVHRTHLTHMGRFAVTAFLHNIGMENTRIIQLYGHVPDFDLQKTMYQVEHISGRGGTGTEYITPLCATMRTHSLCIHPDALCKTITHPLTYYKKKKRMITPNRKKSPVEKNNSGGDVPDNVSTTTDNSHKQEQSDKISNVPADNMRKDEDQDQKDNQA
ncbi:MAG TPA: DNA primase regulatory subunit PriL [Methanospirillum sp.]|nr:DNA primase regulatory subunit PriL [Methanospirillum sp.]